MKLSELIAAVGDDNVAFQVLDNCASKIDGKETSAKITFGTNEVTARDLLKNETPKFGMIVWLPRDKLKAAVEANNTASANQQPCRQLARLHPIASEQTEDLERPAQYLFRDTGPLETGEGHQ